MTIQTKTILQYTPLSVTSSPGNLDGLQASTSAKFPPLDGDLVAPDQCEVSSDALDQTATSLSLLPPSRSLDEPWALRLPWETESQRPSHNVAGTGFFSSTSEMYVDAILADLPFSSEGLDESGRNGCAPEENGPADLLRPLFEGLAHQTEVGDVAVDDAATFNGLETLHGLFNSNKERDSSYVSTDHINDVRPRGLDS